MEDPIMRPRFQLLTILTAIAVAGCLRAQAVRRVTPEKIEFGRLPEGRTVEGDIRFTNTGAVPVHIQRVQPSCGCTTTKTEKMTVDPGDTASIHYSVRTQGFRGIVRKTITVYFTDPQEEELEFAIQGTLYSDLEVTPSFIDFQGVAQDLNATLTQKVTVLNQTEKPLAITSVRATSDLLTVSPSRASLPPGQSQVIQVTLRPSRAQTQDADIWIETDSPSRPKFAVPVFIQIEKKK
jgi:hypothetical protein